MQKHIQLLVYTTGIKRTSLLTVKKTKDKIYWKRNLLTSLRENDCNHLWEVFLEGYFLIECGPSVNMKGVYDLHCNLVLTKTVRVNKYGCCTATSSHYTVYKAKIYKLILCW